MEEHPVSENPPVNRSLVDVRRNVIVPSVLSGFVLTPEEYNRGLTLIKLYLKIQLSTSASQVIIRC